MADNDSSMLTVLEVAEDLKVSRATAYRMAVDGQLPSLRVRGQYRIDRAEYAAWKRQARIAPARRASQPTTRATPSPA